MREAPIEQRLKERLERHGFSVVKLTCPGTNGVPDRMILRPTWSPGPPWFVECKAPKKTERRLQGIIRDQWRGRGMLVLDRCDCYDRVDQIVDDLLETCHIQEIVL